ncbi:MAG: sulfotransferase [Pirellulales bacterium]
MSWQSTLLERLGPGGFCGSTLGEWLRVLRDNRFAVDVEYWPKAAFITANSVVNSLVASWEEWRYGRAIAGTSVHPPLFILGVWRSGTTHLHNLLAKDDRFAFPSTYEVFYPHTFLTTGRSGSRVMQSMMPPTRPMDNVKAGVEEPQEDEFVLVPSGLSFALALVIFPRTGQRYQKFLTLTEATAEELESWKAAFTRFLQKLTLKHQRPLILKSPAHTGRVKVLLDLFPEAKFIHIHRDPYAVFQSSQHTWRRVKSFWGLQRGEVDEQRILQDHVEIYDAFFSQRHRLTDENFCEVRFGELERDPVGQVRRIYEALQLPDFAYVEPVLRDYVETIRGYSRNTFPEMPVELRQRVARAWSRSFEAWGYAK